MDKSVIHRHSGAFASIALLVTFGGVVGGELLERQAPSSPINLGEVALVAAFLSLPASGALLAWRRPTNSVGWLLAGAGTFGGLYIACHGWAVYALRTGSSAKPGGTAAAWVVTWGLVPTFGVLPFLPAVFPTGRIERHRLRQLGRVAVVALVALAVAQAFAPGALDGLDPVLRPIPNPLGVDALRGPISAVTFVAVLVVLAFTFAAIGDAIVRYRRSSGDERRQLRAVAVFPGLIPATIALSLVVPDRLVDSVVWGGQLVGLVGLSLALAVAVLHYRLYDLGGYLRRIAAYLALSAAAVIAVLAVATVVGLILPGSHRAPAAIAAASVAVALGPLRSRLQRGIDRLLFGDRDDPHAVLAEIGAKLEQPAGATSALQEVVDTVAHSLRVPFVAIEADSSGTTSVHHGEADGPQTRIALVHQYQQLGVLVVGHRSADETFTAQEMQLLGDLARQVAVAVYAASVTDALQKTRLDLVRSREEERRRLRRDIHDGIGPTLAGTLLQLDTLCGLIDGQSADAQALAAKVKANLNHLVDDVRRVSHDLRPPALDELGLVGAVREQVAALTEGTGLEVALELPPSTGPVAAAAEVAIYRIASEALTNVVRHAAATRCSIRIRVGNTIELEVLDDGHGIPDRSTVGVGLVSMRERAAEVGGECTIMSADPTGTCVRASVPLAP